MGSPSPHYADTLPATTGRTTFQPRLRDPAPLVEVLAATDRVSSPDTTAGRRINTDDSAIMTQVSRALMRLDETVGAGQSLVATSLLALVVAIAQVLAAQFDGGVGTAVFVLAFITLPLIAVITYYFLK